MTYKKDRIQEITELLLKVAEGNYNIKGDISVNKDEFDAVVIGINMLAEELSATVVSRDHLASIYRGIADLLIVTDKDNKISNVNPAVFKLLNYTEKEIVGQDISILFPNQSNEFLEYANKYLIENDYLYNYETVISTKDKINLKVSVSVSRLRESNKDYEGNIFIAKDITEQVKLRNSLRLKNEALKTFIYKASHDLRGPLASIQGLIELAVVEIDNEVKNEYMSMISQSTDKLAKVLNDLMEFSIISFDNLKFTPLKIKNLIDDVIVNLKYDIQASNIKLKIEDHQSREFKSDSKLLNSILQNIIHNSLKYKRDDIENPEIHINIKDFADGVKITISDNGKGMKQEVLKKIFKMFYRGESGSTGSGLGLFIVKNVIDRLNGKIEVFSKPLEGTKTVLYIPAKSKEIPEILKPL